MQTPRILEQIYPICSAKVQMLKVSPGILLGSGTKRTLETGIK